MSVSRYTARSGAQIVLPVQAAAGDDGGLVTMAGNAGEKQWWHHFHAAAQVEMLHNGHWHTDTGRAAGLRRCRPMFERIAMSSSGVRPHEAGPVGRLLYAVKRRMYRGDRPGRLAKVMNWLSAVQFSAGLLSPARAVTLEVRGRRTGRTVAFPVVVADLDGQRYLVSMLGAHANWVHNVRAVQGRAVIRRGGRTTVRLEEIPTEQRAEILRRYLALAPGARPHFPVSRHAPLADFARIAADYPVFRIIDTL